MAEPYPISAAAETESPAIASLLLRYYCFFAHSSTIDLSHHHSLILKPSRHHRHSSSASPPPGKAKIIGSLAGNNSNHPVSKATSVCRIKGTTADLSTLSRGMRESSNVLQYYEASLIGLSVMAVDTLLPSKATLPKVTRPKYVWVPRAPT